LIRKPNLGSRDQVGTPAKSSVQIQLFHRKLGKERGGESYKNHFRR